MPLTDARRRANNKYIAEHMTVLGCKLKKEDAESFKEECKRRGTTPNAVFKDAIIKFMTCKEDPSTEDLEDPAAGPEIGPAAQSPKYY